MSQCYCQLDLKSMSNFELYAFPEPSSMSVTTDDTVFMLAVAEVVNKI